MSLWVCVLVAAQHAPRHDRDRRHGPRQQVAGDTVAAAFDAWAAANDAGGFDVSAAGSGARGRAGAWQETLVLNETCDIIPFLHKVEAFNNFLGIGKGGRLRHGDDGD